LAQYNWSLKDFLLFLALVNTCEGDISDSRGQFSRHFGLRS
jgi:hypothetical protein